MDIPSCRCVPGDFHSGESDVIVDFDSGVSPQY